jgi:hypothetical protein
MSDKLSRSLSNNSSKTWDTISEDSSFDHEGSLSMRDKLGSLSFQYFEISSPYWRVPLLEKVTFPFSTKSPINPYRLLYFYVYCYARYMPF